MTCWIGHKRMVFLCCGLACGPSDVLLDQMSSCKLNNCVSFLLCGWACAFSDVELYQMTNCIGHKHKLFLCCWLPWDLSELLYVRITSDILSTCASCGRAFATLSRFWRGVRSLSTVVSVKLNNLKLSLKIAETFQAFNWQFYFFQLICWNTCWRWPSVLQDNIRLQQGNVLRILGGLSLLQYYGG